MSESSSQHGGRFQQEGQLWKVCLLCTSIVILLCCMIFLIVRLERTISSLGHLCTTQLQTATTSACLLWWVQEPMSMSLTRGAAPPSTMPLLLTQMESELMYCIQVIGVHNLLNDMYLPVSLVP